VRRDLPPIGLEEATALDQHRLAGVQRSKGAIRHRLIAQRPHPRGRVQLGGRERPNDPMAALRHRPSGTAVPAGLIENPYGAVVGVTALVAGNGGQRQGEDVGGHGEQQAPPALAGAGTLEALDREPLGRAANRGTPGEESDDRPMTARDRIARSPIPLLQLIQCQVRGHDQGPCHPHRLHPHSVLVFFLA
jgi:hypothetical protein